MSKSARGARSNERPTKAAKEEAQGKPTPPAAGPQETIETALRLLHEPGDVFEIRIPHAPRAGTVAGYFDDPAAAAREVMVWDGKAAGIYTTLNPVAPALLSRASNRLKPYAKETTSDTDVLRRRWLLVDIDPIRPAGVSASDDELKAAGAVVRKVQAYLKEAGWPAALVAASGNGGHLLYRIDLANDTESLELVKRVLAGLDARFSTTKVHVDTSVHNAARIAKVPGTLAAKGDSTKERPHRQSRLLEAPEQPEPVPVALLEKMAAHAPERPAGTNGTRSAFDLDTFIDRYLDVQRAKEQPDRTIHILARCPFNSEHDRGEAYVGKMKDGGIFAGCHHNSCTWTWRELRERFEPQTPASTSDRPVRTIDMADPTLDWADPLPLDHCGRLPVFPVNVLPPDFVSFVKEIAESRQVPVDMPAVAVLAALAAAAAGRYRVELPSHSEPCNLYMVCALPPGLRKSQTLTDVTGPLHEQERRLVESEQFKVDRDRAEREIADARAKQLQNKAAKTEDPQERLARQAELAELYAATGDPVTLPRLTFDDATPERVAQLLAENSGRLAMFSAEGGIVGMMAGRYTEKGGPNLDVYLKSHAGDPLRVDRASGRTVNLTSPALTLCLLVQPEVLRELAQVRGGRGRGLLGRFLYSLPEPNLGTRMYRPRGIDPAIEARYHERMLHLFAVQPDGDVRGLELRGEALKVWAAFHDRIERRLTPDGDLRPMADWAAKIAGAAARMAGSFHVAKHPQPETVPIDAETVAAAVTVADYFVAHAGAAFGEMADSPDMALARRVFAWIERREYPVEFSLRDLHQHIRTETPDELLPALHLLEDRSIVRRVKVEPRKPGRHPGPHFLVNPKLENGSQNSQKGSVTAEEPSFVNFVNDSGLPENEKAIRKAVRL